MAGSTAHNVCLAYDWFSVGGAQPPSCLCPHVNWSCRLSSGLTDGRVHTAWPIKGGEVSIDILNTDFKLPTTRANKTSARNKTFGLFRTSDTKHSRLTFPLLVCWFFQIFAFVVTLCYGFSLFMGFRRWRMWPRTTTLPSPAGTTGALFCIMKLSVTWWSVTICSALVQVMKSYCVGQYRSLCVWLLPEWKLVYI